MFTPLVGLTSLNRDTNIRFRVVYRGSTGNSRRADLDTNENFNLLLCKPSNILNADETELFYKVLLNQVTRDNFKVISRVGTPIIRL